MALGRATCGRRPPTAQPTEVPSGRGAALTGPTRVAPVLKCGARRSDSDHGAIARCPASRPRPAARRRGPVAEPAADARAAGAARSRALLARGDRRPRRQQHERALRLPSRRPGCAPDGAPATVTYDHRCRRRRAVRGRARGSDGAVEAAGARLRLGAREAGGALPREPHAAEEAQPGASFDRAAGDDPGADRRSATARGRRHGTRGSSPTRRCRRSTRAARCSRATRRRWAATGPAAGGEVEDQRRDEGARVPLQPRPVLGRRRPSTRRPRSRRVRTTRSATRGSTCPRSTTASTARPSRRTVGKTQSHGCIRLTNWDALSSADAVAPGMPAVLRSEVARGRSAAGETAAQMLGHPFGLGPALGATRACGALGLGRLVRRPASTASRRPASPEPAPGLRSSRQRRRICTRRALPWRRRRIPRRRPASPVPVLSPDVRGSRVPEAPRAPAAGSRRGPTRAGCGTTSPTRAPAIPTRPSTSWRRAAARSWPWTTAS